MAKSIDDLIIEENDREVTEPGRAAAFVARQRRRAFQHAKRELMAKGDLPNTPDRKLRKRRDVQLSVDQPKGKKANAKNR